MLNLVKAVVKEEKEPSELVEEGRCRSQPHSEPGLAQDGRGGAMR
ncbi:hypothetical protein TO73_2860 (plasmid) [Thermus aquaticus Y51MC23]|uniref:Uncharacterized protein n=1 Tax=Thermus aquaticus (strain ATCC BAA-2747 / Y51MC23) TaxID=498848 RepID=A0ABN4IN11_THEA5|nr:hypothetical protein TO73_2860 [Thermus aquaticus Y51MC23]